jgi:hypothetical protein
MSPCHEETYPKFRKYIKKIKWEMIVLRKKKKMLLKKSTTGQFRKFIKIRWEMILRKIKRCFVKTSTTEWTIDLLKRSCQ